MFWKRRKNKSDTVVVDTMELYHLRKALQWWSSFAKESASNYPAPDPVYRKHCLDLALEYTAKCNLDTSMVEVLK